MRLCHVTGFTLCHNHIRVAIKSVVQRKAAVTAFLKSDCDLPYTCNHVESPRGPEQIGPHFIGH